MKNRMKDIDDSTTGLEGSAVVEPGYKFAFLVLLLSCSALLVCHDRLFLVCEVVANVAVYFSCNILRRTIGHSD